MNNRLRRYFGRRVLATSAAGVLALAAAGAAAAWVPATATTATTAHASAGGQAGGRLHPFTIVSPNFTDGRRLPVSAEFGGPGSAGSGCAGKNLAPALRWFNIPAGTAGFAFTINDVDAPIAGGFHHWVVYNIPASVHGLRGHGANPFSEGTNSFGTVGYGGPCPPADGQVHHYVFTVYALSVAHVPGTNITYEQLLSEIAPDVTGATSVIGTFRRPLAG